MMKKILISTLLALAVSLAGMDVRLKDIAAFAGVRDNQLFGYGVVVGLEGTGDTTQNKFTFQTIANYFERMGTTVKPSDFQMRNTASVALTAVLPPFPRAGSKIDVTVSSIGSAKSIQGGVLIAATLLGPDGQVYAVAQGPVSIGGFNASQGGAGVSKNHSTVGRIPGGALVEREIPFDFNSQSSLTLVLNQEDFTTTTRVVETINRSLGGEIASAGDSRTIQIQIPESHRGRMVQLVSALENLVVTPDNKARIVVNERTGTIVFGDNVKVGRIALAHGGISVTVRTEQLVSQPAPFSQGQTVTVPQDSVDVKEPEARFAMIESGATIGDLVKVLNTLGVTPRDIIAILQAAQNAGAISATLEVI